MQSAQPNNSGRLTIERWLFVCAYLTPAVVGVYLHPDYWYWPLSSALISWVVICTAGAGLTRRIGTVALVAITSLANLMLLASLYTQGTGFNEAFFFHLNGETFRVARNVFPALFFGAICLWLLLSLYPFVLRKSQVAKPASLAFLLLTGLSISAPVHSLAAHFTSAKLAVEAPTILLRTHAPEVVVEPGVKPRSLVLIFAESLETLYSDASVFGEDLTPELSSLAKSGVEFTNIQQVQNTGWTMGGLVAAQCAVPMSTTLGANSALANISLPIPQELCLGDILSAYDFRTTYMGGADLRFAGKGRFLQAHGFEEVLGQQALVALQENPEYVSGWGVFDDQLFDAAIHKLEQLATEEAPFLLTLLTLDTHHPAGFPSASCDQSREPGFPSVVRCSDKLIASFIKAVRARHPDAVIALFSDHLSHRNDVYEKLLAQQVNRRLRLFLIGEDIDPQIISKPGTHMDVLPTLMEAIGITAYTSHNLGRSLLSAESGWFSLADPESLILTNDELGLDVSLGELLSFTAKGPSINFGEHTLLATTQGLELRNDVYAVEFDHNRQVKRFLTANAFSDSERLPDGFIVGVSNNRDFNRRYFADGGSPLIYMAGYLNSEEHIVAPLWWQESVTVADFGQFDQ